MIVCGERRLFYKKQEQNRRENAALRGGHDNNKREGLVFGGRGLRVFCPFSDKIAAKRLTAGKCNPLILTVFPLRIALATNILSVVRLCA